MRVARLFLFVDWPEKYFSGQSEGGISNASGTRSVRVSAQGLSRSCCKLSPVKIPSSRLASPGSPRMYGKGLIYLMGRIIMFRPSVTTVLGRHCHALHNNLSGILFHQAVISLHCRRILEGGGGGEREL